MKKLTSLIFAAAMLFSIAFIGEAISTATSTGNSMAVQAQATVKKKRKVGAIRKVYRGGKWVGTKVWNGSRWVARKTWHGTKWVGKKSWKTGRKVVSRTKKVVY